MSRPVPDPDIGQLVEHYYSLLYRFAYRLSGTAADAEDLTQQTFLTAQRKLDQLREAASVRSWLCSILRNLFLKTRRRQTMASLEVLPEPEGERNSDPPEFDSETLQQVLGELPEEFRTPLILFYFEEFSYREIAEQMQVPLGTIMSRLARGRSQLKSKLNALRGSLNAPPVQFPESHD